MKIIPAHSKVICQNENSKFNYFGWPSVCRMPNGALAMVCSGFRTGHVDPFGKGVICYSFDEGKTWTCPAVVIDTPEDDRDCGIVPFGSGVFITTFNNGIDYQLKLQQTVTKLDQAYVNSVDTKKADEEYYGPLYVTSTDGFTFSKVKHLPVTCPHGPCPDKNGGLFLTGNFMNYGQASGLRNYHIDKDLNFELLSVIPNPEGQIYCEPHAIVLDDRILVMIREETTFRLKQCVSFDGGKTFDEGRYIEAIDNGAPPHIMQHSNGTLICVYGRRKEPFGEMVMFSTDKGQTWDCDYYIYPDAPHPDLGYPATVELKDGSLLTVYYQRKEGQTNCVIMQSTWELPEKYRK
ncbi:MAG: exo-alpha-sialidase [Lachnospiraceae bacterium]|nr:exo-alpha-sialidase [Lachnospiraceae bacterium]